MDEKAEAELARRICAAVMSQHLGTGMDFFYRTYLAGRGDLGGVWRDLAELALRVLKREVRAMVPSDPEGALPRGPPVPESESGRNRAPPRLTDPVVPRIIAP